MGKNENKEDSLDPSLHGKECNTLFVFGRELITHILGKIIHNVTPQFSITLKKEGRYSGILVSEFAFDYRFA